MTNRHLWRSGENAFREVAESYRKQDGCNSKVSGYVGSNPTKCRFGFRKEL